MVTFKRQDDNSNNQQQQQQYQEPMSENSMQISTPVILHHNHHHQHQQQMTKKISVSLESSKIIDGPIVIRNQPKILPSSSSSMALFEQRRRSSEFILKIFFSLFRFGFSIHVGNKIQFPIFFLFQKIILINHVNVNIIFDECYY